MAKRAAQRIPQMESYLFEIVGVSPTYSFHVGMQRLEPGAYGEHLHIELRAKCLRPRQFEGRLTEFTFIGDRDFIAATQTRHAGERAPNGVGSLTMRGKQSDYLGTLPYDAAANLALMILAGGYRYIYLGGPAVYRGTSRISSSSFYRQYNPDDLG